MFKKYFFLSFAACLSAMNIAWAMDDNSKETYEQSKREAELYEREEKEKYHEELAQEIERKIKEEEEYKDKVNSNYSHPFSDQKKSRKQKINCNNEKTKLKSENSQELKDLKLVDNIILTLLNKEEEKSNKLYVVRKKQNYSAKEKRKEKINQRSIPEQYDSQEDF